MRKIVRQNVLRLCAIAVFQESGLLDYS
jgi:hypothetical protein